MSTRFSLRVEEDAVVVVRRDTDVRIALDGSITEVGEGRSISRYSGVRKDGAFAHETEIVRPSDGDRTRLILRELSPTAEGLLVRILVGPPGGFTSVALYSHPQDIPLPAPAAAAVDDLDWRSKPAGWPDGGSTRAPRGSVGRHVAALCWSAGLESKRRRRHADSVRHAGGRTMSRQPVFAMAFSKIYPLYVQKAERKNRTKKEVDQIICWLTGYDPAGLRQQIEQENDLETFFARAPSMHPKRSLIKGVVCGVRVEDIEDPLMKEIRYLDKLIDELAKGKPLEKILRQ